MQASPPRYIQIATWLEEQIAAGTFTPDQPIPSETQLATMFGACRETVRHALAQLRHAGLLQVRPGRDTVVAAPTTVVALDADDYAITAGHVTVHTRHRVAHYPAPVRIVAAAQPAPRSVAPAWRPAAHETTRT